MIPVHVARVALTERTTRPGLTGTSPPSQGMSQSSVPWRISTGTGRPGAHVGASSTIIVAATGAIAAIRSESRQARSSENRPPFEIPVAYTRRRSTSHSEASASIRSETNARSSAFVRPARGGPPSAHPFSTPSG